MTPGQHAVIAPIVRFFIDLFGAPTLQEERGGKYPHVRIEWTTRGPVDVYPQLGSVAVGTSSIDEAQLPANGVRGVSVTQGGRRLRIDPGFDAAALRLALSSAWLAPRRGR